MTITQSDRETFQTAVEDFRPQIQEDNCLPTALKNVLDHHADRHGLDLNLSLSDINEHCDYREGMGATARGVPAQLNPEIEDHGLEVRVSIGTSLDDLDAIIEDGDRSLPIVELDDAYFDSIDGYNPRPGIDGYQWTHVVIPFKVNTDKVLFYDPYEKIFARSGRIDIPPTERSQTEFYEWWSTPDTRWTMWIEQRDQQTLTSSRFEE